MPNLLLQKFPAPSFTAITKLSFHPEHNGENAGLAVMGEQWAYISLIKDEEGIKLGLFEVDYDQYEDLTKEIARIPLNRDHRFLRVDVSDGECTFS